MYLISLGFTQILLHVSFIVYFWVLLKSFSMYHLWLYFNKGSCGHFSPLASDEALSPRSHLIDYFRSRQSFWHAKLRKCGTCPKLILKHVEGECYCGELGGGSLHWWQILTEGLSKYNKSHSQIQKYLQFSESNQLKICPYQKSPSQFVCILGIFAEDLWPSLFRFVCIFSIW